MAISISLSDIKELIRALDESDVAELAIESGDTKLALKKAVAGTVVVPAAPAPAAPAPVAAAPVSAAPQAAPAPASRGGLVITSPMVGTFYRSPSPDAPPFVEVGDVVRAGSTVCIIEAMKLMNELESELTGRVAAILVENGEPVEYGQPLIELEPA